MSKLRAAASRPSIEGALRAYQSKRDFSLTPEPQHAGDTGRPDQGAVIFVVQKHWASSLHYDFRLQLADTLKSWAVPKGPSLDPTVKRMAVQVEDHPLAYADFEGVIPAKQYGAGKVIIWDKGTWAALTDPMTAWRDGHLKFELHGHKLTGRWVLVRMKGNPEKQSPWLLIKEKDAWSRAAADFSVVDERPESVKALGLSHGTIPAPLLRRPDEVSIPVRAELAEARVGRETLRHAQGERLKLHWAESMEAAIAAEATDAVGTGEATDALAQGVPAALPDKLAPPLATLASWANASPLPAQDWLFEIKFDGYRMLVRVEHGKSRLFTRNGHDWTAKLLPLQHAIDALKWPSGWFDGELVVPNEHGIPDFDALQQAFDTGDTTDVVLYLFDLPYFNGRDLRELPLEQRRAVLRKLLLTVPSDRVRFSEAFDAAPEGIVASACKLGLEGIIAKRRQSRYHSSRSTDWLKLKCGLRQEFVIGGYTRPQGARAGFGSLLLGVHDAKGSLHYVGNVGSGFNDRILGEVKKALVKQARSDSPFAPSAGADPIEGQPHWVEPTLVAEVSFGAWTRAAHIRHAVFRGLRCDKDARMIVREKLLRVISPAPVPAARQASAPMRSGSAQVTHPQRVIDASTGTTKLDLFRYYGVVGKLMMQHLKARPVSLVRAPDGIDGQLFFQKHAETEKLRGVRQIGSDLKSDPQAMLEVISAQGLLSAAQWNVVEFHTMNVGTASLEHPNRMVFDLDPGDGVPWPQVQEAAQLVHAFLKQLGLPSFLKTSGGKGLHVVVPVRAVHEWETVKGFSQAIVQHMAQTIPQRFVAKSGPKNRVGKVFIDYVRNRQGATTVCAWSARARPGLGISVPVAWSELGSLRGGDHWTVNTVHERLDSGNDSWLDYTKARRSLTVAMTTLGYTLTGHESAVSTSRARSSKAAA